MYVFNIPFPMRLLLVVDMFVCLLVFSRRNDKATRCKTDTVQKWVG